MRRPASPSPLPFKEEADGLRVTADDELDAVRVLGGGLPLPVPRGAARARREDGGLELVLLPLLEPAAGGKSEAVLRVLKLARIWQGGRVQSHVNKQQTNLDGNSKQTLDIRSAQTKLLLRA